MTRLKLRKDKSEYQDDIDRIVRVFRDRGFDISREDASSAWERYSESMCAGWMYLPDGDRNIFSEIEEYFEEVTEFKCISSALQDKDREIQNLRNFVSDLGKYLEDPTRPIPVLEK